MLRKVCMRWLNPSISFLYRLCTLSPLNCEPTVLSADASGFKNSNGDCLSAHLWSVLCYSTYTPLRNSDSVSDNGSNKLSLSRKVYLSVIASQMEKKVPFVRFFSYFFYEIKENCCSSNLLRLF